MLSVRSDLPLLSAGPSHQENGTHTLTHPLTISTIYSKTHTEVKSAAYATTAVHSPANAHQHNCNTFPKVIFQASQESHAGNSYYRILSDALSNWELPDRPA